MYEWSDTDLMFRDALRGFIDKEIKPHVDKLESGELPPFEIIRKMYATFGMDEMATEALEKAFAKEEAKERGETLPESGEKSGGFSGAGSMGVILNSELAGVSLGLVASMGVSLGLTVGTLRSRGTLAQKKRWLPGLVTMEKVGAWAITEPDSGSDAFGGMKSYVRRDGEDYILNGQKTFITNGPYADVTIVYAKLDEGDPSVDRRDRKVLGFVLDKGMEGFTQSPPFKKMGMNSSPTGELFFDNVRITKDRLLGETENPAKGDGKESAKESFAAERIGIASLALGIINECQRLCIDYAKNRKLWGKEIAQFQLIQLKLAEMEVARLNVQNMVFNAIERTAAGNKVTLAEASAMKLYSSRAATEVAMEAVQLFGGNGYMAEYKVEQLARDAKSLMIYAGSNEIQVTHIAKGLLAK
ncbi:acyl-CoA dehydrogenase family protein [Prescottella agglutinans]|uniref:Alkylation response protein AidB-like acyl-CoA dehydrogenase n=1 Tax=Prescottella agglutinans TaxID=1644129 RepID=A0ABT6MAB7_9NOCA|nr:acyl-CoA dehydrogenase family protein [Prescottella agglutinans]MDH6280344.1 alkylation response protein AidB-like acyl-CoA dehydrogenase [Prescottella agglutinans]WFR73380.1 acyl-CoA/acyl-ACP dehydrogenase [Prescottella defluvii]